MPFSQITPSSGSIRRIVAGGLRATRLENNRSPGASGSILDFGSGSEFIHHERFQANQLHACGVVRLAPSHCTAVLELNILWVQTGLRNVAPSGKYRGVPPFWWK